LRILIADDHPVVRKGVCSILKSRKDLEVCAEANNGDEAIQMSLQVKRNLVILDATMPVVDGLMAAIKLKELLPKIPILMLSIHDGPQMIRSAQLVGAQGFVPKSQVEEIL
jgi:DNA-binding NarL/FixJ family response regulator